MICKICGKELPIEYEGTICEECRGIGIKEEMQNIIEAMQYVIQNFKTLEKSFSSLREDNTFVVQNLIELQKKMGVKL